MLKKTFCSIICMMFLLIMSNVVSAQVRPYTFSVTPYLGGYLFDKDQKLSNTLVNGISLGYSFTKYFGVEASGEYIATDYDLTVSGSRSTNVGNYRLDGIFNLIPDSRLVPFVFAGFGGQSINYPENVPNRTASAVDYGAGLKFFFTDWLALRADVRQIYVFDNSKKDIEYTLGLTFYFGGPKPATVAKYEPTAQPTPEPMAKERVVTKASEPKVEEKVVAKATEPKVEPKAEEPVIILATEPMVEEKVVAAVSATKAEEKIIILAFEDVHFDFDKSTLRPEAQTILKRNIQLLIDNPKAKVRIAGYTSASGTEAYNQKLSERRAKAVQEYLINEGVITRDRLSTIGYGETRPAMHEAAPKDLYSKAAMANMRVLFEIIVK
jgi:OOP family OmpA-OmpF porin